MALLSRRRFLGLAGLTAAGILADGGRLAGHSRTMAQPWRQAPALASIAFDAAWLASGSLADLVVDGDVIRPSTGRLGICYSPVVEAPFSFNSLGLHWTQTSPGAVSFETRVSWDGWLWSEWQSVQTEDGHTAASSEVFGAPLGVYEPLPRFAQLSLSMLASGGAAPAVSAVTIVFIDSSQGPTTADALDLAGISEADVEGLAAAAKPPIISRTAWGCPEGQGSPGWPPEYRSVTNLFIHHTATGNSQSDWAAMVRSIWSYHSTVMGWRDIGYNFLVDPNGNVYEGRAGGDDVIAGHTYGFNSGTMGLAFIGTYSTVVPSSAMVASAQRLLAWKAAERCLDPAASNSYLAYQGCPSKSFVIPCLLGHRDAPGHSSYDRCNIYGTTTCPGDALEATIPAMRAAVRAMIPLSGGPSLTQVVFSPTTIVAGALLRVDITVVNNSCGMLAGGQNPAPGFVYEEGESFNSRGHAGVAGEFRVGVDMRNRSQAEDYPYRWSLGDALAPGASRTITGYIRMRNTRTSDYWAGLVEESVRWWQSGVGTTVVTVVTAPSVNIDPVSTAKTWFVLSWSGSGGIGTLTYSVETSVDGSNWQRWITATTATRALFAGQANRSYHFRVRANDSAGNTGAFAATIVQTGADFGGLYRAPVSPIQKNR